jgi:ATP-dependent protease ClpP protease subunit
MEDQVKVERFEKLKSMRDALCAAHQKWLLEQVQELKKISECQDCTVENIKTKIDEILCEIASTGGIK